MNQDNAKLRRYEDDLNVGGFGIIILGVWSVLKLFMQILSRGKEVFNVEELMNYDKIVIYISFAIVIVGLIILALLVFWLHIYVGLNAMKAAKGQAYKKGYVFWAVIHLLLILPGLFSYKDSIVSDWTKIDTILASMIVDLTTLYILGTILVASWKIRQLKSKKQVQE